MWVHGLRWGIATTIVVVAFVAACEAEDGGSSSADTSVTGTDATTDGAGAGGCHELGVPFSPPAGVDDPWQLRVDEHCCDMRAQQISFAETPSDGGCQLPAPLAFVCIAENGDGVCDLTESFCTSPQDCPPPDATYPLCCGEGDRCGMNAVTGVNDCCDGLEAREIAFWSAETGCMAAGGGSVCVRACGDGQCSAGENRCNCEVDCAP